MNRSKIMRVIDDFLGGVDAAMFRIVVVAHFDKLP